MTGDIVVTLNTDYMPVQMDSQTLTSLVESWIKGAISKRELYDALQKGEIIDAAKSYEEHEAEIAEDPPALGMAGDDGDGW